ncbi:MAG: hypothetical protein J0I28_00975 [Caulobacterales bacterium]|nr:hypothetical protein [Caulobacterales bacterium]
MDFETVRLIGRLLYYGLCVAAVLRGDRPLRYVGVLIIANALLSPIVQPHDDLRAPRYGVMAIDFMLLLSMALILLRDRRWWLVVATALCLMTTLTHLAGLIGAPIESRITYFGRLFWAYGMVAALAYGLVERELHRRNPRRQAEATVRALVAEHGEARTRAELDRRYLVATNPTEKARAAELSEALRQLTLTRERDGAM